jgi:hypothetical protein
VLERLGNIAKNMIIVNYLKIYKRCSVWNTKIFIKDI